MLGKTFRLVIQNATGSALGAGDTATVTGILKNFSSSGVLTFSTTQTLFNTSIASLASNGYQYGTAFDNSASGAQWLEGDLLAVVTITPATGQLNWWIQESPDGGTTWPADGQGEPIGSQTVKATGAQPNYEMSI